MTKIKKIFKKTKDRYKTPNRKFKITFKSSAYIGDTIWFDIPVPNKKVAKKWFLEEYTPKHEERGDKLTLLKIEELDEYNMPIKKWGQKVALGALVLSIINFIYLIKLMFL